ncbi:hypothetical protein BS47DRAFT_1347113 [Hydnum rufescens UP504]|uniref:Uncharacterized protein n=1 Tax=Hydnum rufescens UP504 TaxID=1448309 RepID=A0A9P6ASG6_9AGAM|nr:hypothetical protein BS47DRAFT_1347113 [Hydnum rufescens UP504]
MTSDAARVSISRIPCLSSSAVCISSLQTELTLYATHQTRLSRPNSSTCSVDCADVG